MIIPSVVLEKRVRPLFCFGSAALSSIFESGLTSFSTQGLDAEYDAEICDNFEKLYCSAKYCCQGLCTSEYQKWFGCYGMYAGCEDVTSCNDPCQDAWDDMHACEAAHLGACTHDDPYFCFETYCKSLYMIAICCLVTIKCPNVFCFGKTLVCTLTHAPVIRRPIATLTIVAKAYAHLSSKEHLHA